MSEVVQAGAWNQTKVKRFRNAFMEFLKHVRINSKETGGGTVLADHIYEAQRRFLDCIFEGLANDIHDFKILKSRQLGISTMSRALSIFWLGYHPGLSGSLVFDTQAHREEARNEMMTMLRDLPPELNFPGIKKDSRDMLVLDSDSTLRFLNAGVRKSKTSGTLGRSSGLNFAHNSEMCSWENDEGLTSYKNALSETFPDRLYIWESTARGFNMWWDIWKEARNDTLNQKTCFIGWWAKESQMIARGTPAFAKYGMAPPTEDEKLRIAEVEQLYDHKVTQEQLAWYRRKSNPLQDDENEDQEGGVDELMRQEQPWTAEEAFLQSGSTFFPGENLTEIRKTTANDKYKGFTFINGSDFFNCDFLATNQKRFTQLKIWEDPDPDGAYVLAADPAFGHDETNNHSAIQVLRCYADCIEQVAEYRNASIQPQAFAWLIAALAGYYRNTNVVIEINGPGEAVLLEYKGLKGLISTGYLRDRAAERGLRDILSNTRDFMYSRADSLSDSGSCLHWKTTGSNKVGLMERCRDFVCNKGLILHSYELLDEMKTVIRNGDTIAAEGRNRDDRTVALAIGVRAWERHVRKKMSVAGRTRDFEIKARKMTVRDQIDLFNKHRLDLFFKQKQRQRVTTANISRRASWRDR